MCRRMVPSDSSEWYCMWITRTHPPPVCTHSVYSPKMRESGWSWLAPWPLVVVMTLAVGVGVGVVVAAAEAEAEAGLAWFWSQSKTLASTT